MPIKIDAPNDSQLRVGFSEMSEDRLYRWQTPYESRYNPQYAYRRAGKHLLIFGCSVGQDGINVVCNYRDDGLNFVPASPGTTITIT